MNRIIAAALAVTAFTGCGPVFTGTVSGYGLSVQDELFVTMTDNTGASTGAALVLTDQPQFCSTLAATKAPADLSLVAFVMDRTVDGKYLAPDTGDYVVGAQSGGSITGMFMHTDANGTNELPSTNRTATSGRLKVTAFQAGNAMSGSFDGKFGAQNDPVSFSFNAHNCTIDTTTFLNGFLVGAGSYSQNNNTSGAAGSCTFFNGANEACIDFIGTGYTWSQIDTQCSTSSGVHTATKCPTGAYGTCTVNAGTSTWYATHYISVDSTVNPQQQCTNSGGTFSYN
jgi:hypothetical protein